MHGRLMLAHVLADKDNDHLEEVPVTQGKCAEVGIRGSTHLEGTLEVTPLHHVEVGTKGIGARGSGSCQLPLLVVSFSSQTFIVG